MGVLSFLFVALSVVVCVNAELWNRQNDPKLFSDKYQYKFSQLPLNGTLPTKPWSDDYWASFEGGIAHRWYNSEEGSNSSFHYPLHTKDELFAMSWEDKMKLSPAEKFDLFNERYDFPIVNSEWRRTSPEDEHWWGICHGWAPASIHYKEPKPINITNKAGLVVPFGSSDIKALLSYFVAEYQPSGKENLFIGDRCNRDLESFPEFLNNTECIDMNAGSFHIIIANQLAIKQHSFVVDRDRSSPVWNQPVFKYRSTVQKSEQVHNSTEGVVRRHYIDTTLFYIGETYPSYEPDAPWVSNVELKYTIDVDDKDDIVGGDYLEYDRMDFMWTLVPQDFSGYFSNLQHIYDTSIGANKPVRVVNTRGPFDGVNALPLVESAAEFGANTAEQDGRAVKVWKIQPQGAESIGIKFHNINTRRFIDKVRIYEGENGPLVAVVHGNEIPSEYIFVNAKTAYVVFNSDGGEASGFSAEYFSVNH
ncbi:Csmd3 [Acrasis kona]|uniref:Csmd3 n=1 Tax=Acrasis kona TaxID=1008807 RepID=A0AAW2YTT7_9EUKA